MTTTSAAPEAMPAAAAFSPLYRQIKALLRRSLQSGEWRPGEMIPSEFELAARFRVSQGTVRKAIDALADENLLVRRQGKGTFVATHAEETTRFRFLRLTPDAGEAGLPRAPLHRLPPAARAGRCGAGARPEDRRGGGAPAAAFCRCAGGRWCSTTSGCRAGRSAASPPSGWPAGTGRSTACSSRPSACA